MDAKTEKYKAQWEAAGKTNEYLHEKYKDILTDDFCGIDCPTGWLQFVEPALEKIKAKGGKIAQVKQKFCMLVIYYDGPRTNLTEYEIAASKTCEFCGSPARAEGLGVPKVGRRSCEGCR